MSKLTIHLANYSLGFPFGATCQSTHPSAQPNLAISFRFLQSLVFFVSNREPTTKTSFGMELERLARD
jgi:hypothetical protein